MPRNRRTIRYKGYNYAAPGAYFVTICTRFGRSIFGHVHNHDMVLNQLGQLASACWQNIPTHHPHVALDAHVVMPNHMHGLLWLHQPEQGAHETVLGHPQARPGVHERKFGQPIAGSLSTLVGLYKGAVTRQARRQGLWPPDENLWQGRFWDRIVRNETELQRIRGYIQSNPARWVEDQLHPSAPPNRFNRSFRSQPNE